MLLEAGVMSVGSMNGAMPGKNYNRSINCHKVMAESMERLVLDKYLKTGWLKGQPRDLLQAINHIFNEITLEYLDTSMQNKPLANFLEEYCSFRQQLRSRSLSKTAQFWLTYMNHVLLVFTFFML